MENIKKFEIDGNILVEDIDNNRYYIIFKNYFGERISSEIPKEVFDTYYESKKSYKRNQNEKDRHWEQMDLTENSLYQRAINYPKSLEKIVIENEEKNKLSEAKKILTKTQFKRIKLHIEDGLTLEKIAKIEGVRRNKIDKSITLGLKKLRKILKVGGQNS